MLIANTSIFTGEERTLDLDITIEQLQTYLGGGAFVQDVFPHLSPDEREFLMYGILPGERGDR